MKIKSANTRTIELPGALGSVTISGEFNFFKLANYERRFVLDVLDAFDKLEENQRLFGNRRTESAKAVATGSESLVKR